MKNDNILYLILISIPFSLGISYLSVKFFGKNIPPSFFALGFLVCYMIYYAFSKNERD